MATSHHLAYSDAIFIPLLAALLGIGVRFIQLEKKDVRAELWGLLAIGPDLMVAAVVAIPGLVAARNLGLHEASLAPPANSGGTSPGATAIMAVLMALLLLCGANYDRLWGKEARTKTGVKAPLLVGIVPPVAFGVGTLALALFVGTS